MSCGCHWCTVVNVESPGYVLTRLEDEDGMETVCDLCLFYDGPDEANAAEWVYSPNGLHAGDVALCRECLVDALSDPVMGEDE